MEQATERLEHLAINGHRIATAWHAAADDRVVLCCHGFRGSKLGPQRLFVGLARRLQSRGIAALRFDQYGSGDSTGDFFDSSFDDWIATTTALVRRYRDDGYQVALLGQSMEGATALAVAGDLGCDVASVVAWVPDPSVEPMPPGPNWSEEGGQRVGRRYWREAHDADIVGRFRAITAPTLVFLATADAYVSAENRRALLVARQPHQEIALLEGWPHSAWTHDQATQVVERTVAFFAAHFATPQSG